MADIKISALPAATTVVPGTDVLPLVSNAGTDTVKATPNQIVQAVLPAPGPIGGTTPAAFTGTTITANTGFVGPVGATTPNTGAFTTLSASSTVSGTVFSNYLSTPPAIGGTTPNTGAFTTVAASGSTSGSSTTGAFRYGALSYAVSNLLASYASSANSAVQTIIQNTNSGATASTDVVVSNDLGTASTYYGVLGMNSSGFTGTGSLSLPNATYVYSQSGDLVLGTNSANGIHFVVANGATDALAISSAGVLSGTAISNYLAAPPAIGGTTPNAGSFTKVTTSAGTASVAPINMTAGTNLTSATAGAVEYDGTVAYLTPTANCRGVLPAEQFIMLTSAYTLTSAIGVQKMFNASTNGAVTLPVGTFMFDCAFNVSTLATTGTFGFALGGTATFAQYWTSTAARSALATAATAVSTYNTAANTALTATSATTTAYAKITGYIRVTVAGTIIPQFSQTVASAAVIGLGSYFSIKPMGSSTVTTVGNWS